MSSPTIDQTTYDILKQRLATQGNILQERLTALGAERKRVFGALDMAIIGSERVVTPKDSIPRDLEELGKLVLFGYNQLKGVPVTQLTDIINCYSFDGTEFHAVNEHPLNNPVFLNDFKELFKFYSQAKFLQFLKSPGKLNLVFQTGATSQECRIYTFSTTEGVLNYEGFKASINHSAEQAPDFNWVEATRKQHVVSTRAYIDLEVLQVSPTREGLKFYLPGAERAILTEDISFKDQTLVDIKVESIRYLNILLVKVTPYKEPTSRYYAFQVRSKTLLREDSLAWSICKLPEDHGVIFARGILLQDGTSKLQEQPPEKLVYHYQTPSRNGEDTMFVFYNESSGLYLLLRYNLIDRHLDNPIYCHGFSLHGDGKMVLFNNPNPTAVKSHAMQIWQTPFYDADHAPKGDTKSYLSKIGNTDLVTLTSEVQLLLKLVNSPSYTNVDFQDMIEVSRRVLDLYRWLTHESVNLYEPIHEIKVSSVNALTEYDKVVELQTTAVHLVEDLTKKAKIFEARVLGLSASSISDFTSLISELRIFSGELSTAEQTRYVAVDQIKVLEEENAARIRDTSEKCITYLNNPNSLEFFSKKKEEVLSQLPSVTKSSQLPPVNKAVETMGSDLDLLILTVNSIPSEDPAKTSALIDRLTALLSDLNQTRAKVRALSQSLGRDEAATEFQAQFKLLGQSTSNYIDLSTDVEKLDEYQTKTFLTLEELESKFSEQSDYLLKLTEKREEITTAFASKRQSLESEKNKHIESFYQSGQRILKGISSKASQQATLVELSAFFASDLMVHKLKDLAKKLDVMGDSVKAEDLRASLKRTQDDLSRTLKDKLELFSDGALNLGGHLFSINRRPLEIALLIKDGQLAYHVTGTDFYENVVGVNLDKYKAVLQQSLISESDAVNRASYLAYQFLQVNKTQLPATAASFETTGLTQLQALAQQRYEDGYVKGVHEDDAFKFLSKVLPYLATTPALQFSSESRGLAHLVWNVAGSTDVINAQFKAITHQAAGLSKLLAAGKTLQLEHFTSALENLITLTLRKLERTVTTSLHNEVKSYLLQHLLYKMPLSTLASSQAAAAEFKSLLSEDIARFDNELNLRYGQAKSLVQSFLSVADQDLTEETTVLILYPDSKTTTIEVPASIEIEGLLSEHNSIQNSKATINLSQWLESLRYHSNVIVPLFQELRELKKTLTHAKAEELKLPQFQAQVFSGFVRNELISKVYMQLIGANLAKQIGSTGDKKRTDLMGLLLLISPPGYGKTTLVEYVANRLGLALVKVNGPAIGHEVTSVDPETAPNATAKDELRKLNLAFEMGNNVMIYLDDIQHLNSEFLQKFISLCDGQRKIEGVYKGVSKTYQFRGKKVAIIMAGNPYTETGDKFKIPDMLANRADVYNLGDVGSSHKQAFETSFLENALTSNPVLKVITERNHEDIHRFLSLVNKAEATLDGTYTQSEITDIINILEKAIMVREFILKANTEYIKSASQQDAYRVEPPFKLQGSYRNMNRIVEKLVPVMTKEEVLQVVMDGYHNESQTLTQGAEANFLKFKEMCNVLSVEEAKRLGFIRAEFVKLNSLGGADTDQVGKILMQFTNLNANINKAIEAVLTRPVQSNQDIVGLKNQIATEFAEEHKRDLSTLKLLETQILTTRKLAAQLKAVGQEIKSASLNAIIAEIQNHDVTSDDLITILRRIIESTPKVEENTTEPAI